MMGEASIAVAAPPAVTGAALRRKVGEMFGIDRRTLAAFRVALGVLLLADLASRAQFLTELYTDRGMLPRAVYLAHSTEAYRPSLHLMAGGVWAEGFLFAFAALCAVALLVGYRTRLATVLCWVMAYSVQARNPFVHTGGDTVILQMLFWSMLLPLGMHWSVDRALDTSDRPVPERVLSVASFGLMAHIGMLYVFSTHLKAGPEWRENFTALYYGLSLDSIASPVAIAALDYPRLLQVLTLATLLLEALGPVLAFSPILFGPIRCLVILGFWALHAGIAICFSIGLFPYVMIVAWIAWIPGWFWDRFLPYRARPERRALRVYYDGECQFCLRFLRILQTFLVLPDARIMPAQSDPAMDAVMTREHSWVVLDHRGAQHLRFSAFACLCRWSPILWWLAPLLRLPPVVWLGDLGYRAVAAHRTALGRATRWLALEPRPAPSRAGTVAVNVMAAVLLTYVFLFNLGSVNKVLRSEPHAPQFAALGYLLQMHQGWAMFAPAPRKEDGWLIMPAVLANGQTVDLYRAGAPFSSEKPALVSDTYPSQRMWTYLMNLIDHSDMPGAPFSRAYADYVIRRWNAAHPPEERVVSFLILWMQELTPPPGEPQQPATPKLIYTHAFDGA